MISQKLTKALSDQANAEEEEASASDVLSKIQIIGDNTGLLLALDTELTARTFVNPFPNMLQ